MLVPFDISIALSFFAFLCGGLVGICLRRHDEAPVDLRPQLLAYAAKVEELERPMLIEWTPATVTRFRIQQETARQLSALRTISGRIA